MSKDLTFLHRQVMLLRASTEPLTAEDQERLQRHGLRSSALGNGMPGNERVPKWVQQLTCRPSDTDALLLWCQSVLLLCQWSVASVRLASLCSCALALLCPWPCFACFCFPGGWRSGLLCALLTWIMKKSSCHRCWHGLNRHSSQNTAGVLMMFATVSKISTFEAPLKLHGCQCASGVPHRP